MGREEAVTVFANICWQNLKIHQQKKMAAAHSSETLSLVPTFITYSRRILLSAGLRHDTNLRIW